MVFFRVTYPETQSNGFLNRGLYICLLYKIYERQCKCSASGGTEDSRNLQVPQDTKLEERTEANESQPVASPARQYHYIKALPYP